MRFWSEIQARRWFDHAKTWDAVAIAFLGAWHFIYFWPVTLGQQVFIDGDILYSFLPFHTELARALSEGRLPLWTPGIQAGFPLFAEGEVGALYPPNLIFHLLLPAPIALSYIILFNWSWASIGMYLLCRSQNLRVASAVLAALVFGASGFMIARAPHVPLVAVASWLPWLFFLQIMYWRARRDEKPAAGWFLLMSMAIGVQILGGHPQLAIVGIALFVLAGLGAPFYWNHERQASKTWFLASLHEVPKTGWAAILSGALGVGLVAIQLIPTAELVLFSTRGQELGQSFFTSFSLAPSYLTQFVSPFQQLGAPAFYNTEYWGYFGLLALVLAGLAPWLRRDLRTWTWFLLALGALVLSLGGYTPLYGWLYQVPVFNRFRVPARFLFLFTFAGAYLAGVGLQELRNRLGGTTKIGWKQVALGVVFAAVVLVVIDQAYAQPSAFWLDLWTRLPWLWLFLSIGIVALASRHMITQFNLAIVVLGFALLDLLAFAAPFMADSTQMIPPSEVLATPRTVRVMDDSATLDRFLSDKWPSTTRASIRNALLTNIALLYGEQSATAYEPSLALQRNVEYTREMSAAMRDLLNIRYYLIPLQSLPWDKPPSEEAEPEIGLTPDLLRQQPKIPPTRVVRIRVVSYTDQSSALPDGFLAGEIVLTLNDGKLIVLPLRLGIETADWAFEGMAKIGKVDHSKPANSTSFLAYLSSVGSEFRGNKYTTSYDVAANDSPIIVTSVGVRFFLPDAGLKIESISLIDEKGHSISLASLLQRNDLSLVFRSQTAAMWENLDVLPRAFLVHHAEIVKDNQMLARLKEHDFHPDQVVLLSDGRALDPSGAGVLAQSTDQVLVTDYQSEQVTISVRTDHAGYLMLADSWYPGWVARVDGQDTSIYRADYMFRAVRIEPGQHQVVFEYQPFSFVLGAWISGLSVTALLFLSISGFRFWQRDRGTAK